MSKPCPTCGGTGRTWGLTCRTCDGDANVPQQKPKPKPKG